MKRHYYIFPFLLIIILLGCNINPIAPSLNELNNETDYFPLDKYSEYNYISSKGDTLVLTIMYSFDFNGAKVYEVNEITKSNTVSYDLVSRESGVYFYTLGYENPFLRYPLVQDFTWEFPSSLYYYIFSVLSLSEMVDDYEDVLEIQWDFYNNTLNNNFVKTYYYYFGDGIGPVQIIQNGITYIIKDLK
ncbi:hypothetical protein J7L48_03605 [bacterium]|nr:hypothetical protein [bacterium]